MALESATDPQTDPLLQTKFFIPSPKDDLVRRQRLIDLLQNGLVVGRDFGRKLTLISAPAGYGKTTLAVQWLNDIAMPIAWLSLDAADNDPKRFLTYLAAAIQTCFPNLETNLAEMLAAPQPPPMKQMLTVLLNRLAGWDKPFILVLDDYHVIQSRPIHEGLDFIVERLPSNVHIVITSREDPPLPLHRLRARRQSIDVRQHDLSFSEQEALLFFHSTSNLQLSTQQTGSINRRTEGWVTGLQLAALSMHTTQDLDAFIQSFTGSNRYILDYLFEEVFNRQPQGIKSFLLKTAILDRICAPLADAVTDSGESQSILERLEQSNFFLLPLDQKRAWYRYHRLFADLLRHRLGQSDREVKDLHARASRWFAGHGHFGEAIEHALQGEHWEMAGGWIDTASDRYLRRGEITTLLSWCRRMPEEILLSQPGWSLAYAWPLILIGEVQEAERVLQSIKRITGDQDHELHGQIAAAEAFLSRSKGDMQKTIAHSKEALALLPEHDRASRGNLNVNLGLITWHIGELDEAEPALRAALEDTAATGNHYAHHTALVFLARTNAARGDLTSALINLERAASMGDEIPTAVLVQTDLAAIYYERNQLESAWHHLERAAAIARNLQNIEFLTACHVQRSLFHLGCADIEAASEALRPALTALNQSDLPPLTRARITACQLQILLAAGELKAAQQVRSSINISHDAQTFYRFIDLNTARYYLACGDKQQARTELNRSFKLAARSSWGYARYAIYVLQAHAAESTENALVSLKPALLETENQGFVRLFLQEGAGLLPALRRAAQEGVASTHVGRILSAVDRKAGRMVPTDDLVEALTERELEVLNLVAAGLSNRQIADQLVISIGTTKAHLHHIFGKLAVSNRTEASARARELGLI
ncbi:MAG: LuxR C-terminal-related transcriptional regulator [Anaerolineales bacterium]|jgi:LuxR family maltose regulon positive regulatory protein